MIGKLLATIVGFVVAFLILVGTIFYFVERKSSHKAFNQWYEKEYREQNYFGSVRKVETYNFDNCLFSISFRDQNSHWDGYSFDCACKVDGFMEFVQEGDSIIKKKDETKLIFIKPDGTSKVFEPPFCQLR